MKKLKYVLRSGNKVIGKYKVLFEKNRYSSNGNLYLALVYRVGRRWQTFCDVTINLNRILPEDTAYVDISDMPDMLDWLVKNNFAKNLNETQQAGLTKYPIVRFNMDEIEKYCYEDDSTDY